LEPRAWLIRPVFAEEHANFLWLMFGCPGGLRLQAHQPPGSPGSSRNR